MMLVRGVRVVPKIFRPSMLRFFSDSLHFDTKKSTFSDLGITSAPLCASLASLHYRSPTIVQQQAIPRVLQGADLVIASETGCGKTLAYLLPLMELLLSGKTISGQKFPPVIILFPSQELARQTFDVFVELCAGMGTTFLLPRIVVGTEKFPAPLHKITDVLFTTATTFEENERAELITGCHHLILDEADSLLVDAASASTRRILHKFVKAYAPSRNPEHSIQYLFVGATIPTHGTKSVDAYLKKNFPSAEWLTSPLLHRHKPNLKQTWIEAPCEPWEIAKLSTWRLQMHPLDPSLYPPGPAVPPDIKIKNRGLPKPPGLGEVMTPVAEKRLAMLYEAIGEDPKRRTMIFCTSFTTCQQVSKYLADKNRSGVMLHGRTPTLNRQDALKKFGNGEVNIFVCTNAATRGIDLVVDHVIQYDFAENVVDHIHRIGRTGRVSRLKAGATEACVTNFFTIVNRALVDTIRERGDQNLEGSFSRKASFKKKIKKQLGIGAASSDEGQGEVLEEEEPEQSFR